MKRKVFHFIRKKFQLNSSFIQNQILNHINFEPVIIFRQSSTQKDCNCNFVMKTGENIKIIDLGKDETLFENNLFHFCKRLSFRQSKKLRKLVQEIKPDIMHFHYGTDAGIYLEALKNSTLPKMVSFYGYDCFSFPKKFFGLGRIYLKKRVFQHSSIIIAMSPEMKKDLLNLGCPPDKIVIHYHGVPSNLLTIKKANNQKETITILMLSYIDPVKGHIFVLKSLSSLIKQGVLHFKLRIVGTGHYAHQIKRFVSLYRLDQHVEFVGQVKYLSAEYFKEFDNADIFLHPSVTTKNDKEGIPGSLVEAMLASLPPITTYHGGIPYIIQNKKTGLLVKEWDVNNLTIAIKSLIINTNLRHQLGIAARSYAKKNLTLHNKEIELENIYNSFLKT